MSESESKSKKKLLVTASTFPRWENDTEPRFILDLCRHMTDQFDVTVLVPAAPGAKEKEVLEGVTVIRYHYFPIHKWETLCYPGAIVPRIREKKVRILLVPFLFLSLYIQLARRLPKYDVVHAHWLIPQGIVQSFFKKPYIVTGHGGDVTSLNKGVFKKLKIRCLKKAGQVTVVSEHLKSQIQKLLPDTDPHVISMGVDSSRFGKQYRVLDYFGQGEKKVVLFVGRLAEKKGVTYLIEAMKEIDAVLIIVGEGPLAVELINQAAGMEEKVTFLGAKTHEELKVIYASSDIFVAPSITAENGDQEGVPTAIMEAIASGLSVVASNSGGISSLIKNDVNGLLIREKDVLGLRNSINKLIKDSDLMDHFRKENEIIVSRYGYDVIAEKYKKIFVEMG